MNLDTIHKRIDAEQERIYKREKAAGTPITKAQARVEAWKENPTLKELSRKADAAPPAKETDMYKRIVKAVDDRARIWLGARDNWHLTGAQMRDKIWHTPDGEKLKKMYRELQHVRRNPTKTLEVLKSSEHADAYEILKRWEKNPGDGLTI